MTVPTEPTLRIVPGTGDEPSRPASKALLAIPSLGSGGPDKVFATVASGLAEAGWQVTVAVQRNDVRDKTLHPLVQVVRIRSHGWGWLDRQPVFGLLRVVRRERPDVVVSTLRMTTAGGLARPLFPRGTRFVVRPANHMQSVAGELAARSWKYRVADWLDRLALRRADAAIAQSDDLRVSMRVRGYQGPVHVIGNPIGIEPSTNPVEHLSGHPALLAVGRLTAQKGFDVLLDSLPRVVESHPETELHLVGRGPDEAELRVRASLLGVADQVVFHGFRDDVLDMMRGADLLVSSSRYEGFSNVILEGQSVGTPVVATRCPGAASEVLDVTDGGILVDSDDADALAAGIIEALADDDRFDRADIARRTSERWSTEAITAAYDAFLREVAAGAELVAVAPHHGT